MNDKSKPRIYYGQKYVAQLILQNILDSNRLEGFTDLNYFIVVSLFLLFIYWQYYYWPKKVPDINTILKQTKDRYEEFELNSVIPDISMQNMGRIFFIINFNLFLIFNLTKLRCFQEHRCPPSQTSEYIHYIFIHSLLKYLNL